MISVYAYHNWFRWLMIHWVFQWLLCFLYWCTLSCCCLCKVCSRSSHVCHMCSVLFLPEYGLLKCFRSSHACHVCSDLFLPVQSLLTCMTALHCGHTFLRCIDPLYSIACTTVLHLSEVVLKDSHKRLSSTEKPQYHVLQVTWSHITVTYVLRRGIQKHCMSRKWLT